MKSLVVLFTIVCFLTSIILTYSAQYYWFKPNIGLEDSQFLESYTSFSNKTLVYFIPKERFKYYKIPSTSRFIVEYNNSQIKFENLDEVSLASINSWDVISTSDSGLERISVPSNCKYFTIEFFLPLKDNITQSLKRISCAEELPDDNLQTFDFI